MSKRAGKWKKKAKPYKSPKSEDLDSITGRWKVEEVVYESEDGRDASGEWNLLHVATENPAAVMPECRGVELLLDDQCDVTWVLPKEVEPVPLFQTTSFNVHKESGVIFMEFMGGPDGKTFTFYAADEDELFQLRTPVSNNDEQEGSIVITISRAEGEASVGAEGFSLQEALDGGFFSDLVVKAADGTVFHVHRMVLGLCGISYRDWEIFVSALKSTTAKAVLTYIYSDSLPPSLCVADAKELLAVASAKPKLSPLAELLKTFIGSHDLKQRLIQLVDDIQTLLEHSKRMIEATEVTNPAKVSYIIKQLAREAAVGAAKFGLLCEMYSRNKKEMTKKEKQEVLEYVRARVVVFLDLFSEVIQSASAKFNFLSASQQEELALYIIPEVERIWDIINSTSGEVETAMSSRISSLSSSKGFKRQDLKLSFLLHLVSRGTELKRLQKLGEEFQDFVIASQRKREEFRSWSNEERVEKILRVMHGLENEGSNFMSQLQEAKHEILVENALEWKKYKILVAVCCSYVAWGLRKALPFRDPLKPLVMRACKFVRRSEVNEGLLYFDLLSSADVQQLQDDTGGGEECAVAMPRLEGRRGVGESLLAASCLKLLGSSEHSDMQFVLEGGEEAEGVVIPAHRVIVAARCEWFKRALQSGMKEAIDRKIVIHDCEEKTFRLFLHYLYGGVLSADSMAPEGLCELLAVADRYEAPLLRSLCEELLVARVGKDSVFPLLLVADRYSARKLREATFHYVLAHPDVIMEDVEGYSNLSDELKQELRTLLAATSDPTLALRHQGGAAAPPKQPEDKTTTITDTDTQAEAAQLRQASASNSSSSSYSSSGEETQADPTDADAAAFQSSLAELRGVIGEEPTDDLLRDLLLAADSNVNRAANYYFSTQGD